MKKSLLAEQLDRNIDKINALYESQAIDNRFYKLVSTITSKKLELSDLDEESRKQIIDGKFLLKDRILFTQHIFLTEREATEEEVDGGSRLISQKNLMIFHENVSLKDSLNTIKITNSLAEKVQQELMYNYILAKSHTWTIQKQQALLQEQIDNEKKADKGNEESSEKLHEPNS